MAVTILSEPVRPGEYLVSEHDGSFSRDVAVIAAGANLVPGTVLGKVTASGKLTILAPGASDGSQTAVAVLYGPANAAAADVKQTITARSSEVNGLVLTWPAGITNNQQTAAITQLASVGILVRS
jgi:hypothetical protein